MTELYTMQRYLQQYTLERNGLANFDSWAATFGETVTAIELAPEGTGYRTKHALLVFSICRNLWQCSKNALTFKQQIC